MVSSEKPLPFSAGSNKFVTFCVFFNCEVYGLNKIAKNFISLTFPHYYRTRHKHKYLATPKISSRKIMRKQMPTKYEKVCISENQSRKD